MKKMKKQSLVAALMLPLAFVACTNDEFESLDVQNSKGDMITLSENFALGVSKGDAVVSRAAYVDGLSFYWQPELDDNQQPVLDRIGLSWIGAANDGKVYTNYEFTHFAWNKIKKVVNGAVTELYEADINECSGKWEGLYNVSEKKNFSTYTIAADEPYTKNGYFNTKLTTIFGGDYLVYTPYNDQLFDVDNLIAKSGTVFDVNAPQRGTNDSEKKQNITSALAGLANEVFCVGYANILGGTSANGFTLSPVSGIIRLQIDKANDVNEAWENINKIVIYGKDGIVVEQAIDATKVKDATNVANSLIASDVRKTSTSLIANLNNKIDIDVQAKENNWYTVCIPALPQTIKGAEVVLFDEEGKSAVISVGDIEVSSNKAKDVRITLTNDNKLQDKVFYVADMETFAVAMRNAGLAKDHKDLVTIKLLNDIVYDMTETDDPTNGVVIVNKNMTITGGDIIVPAGQKLDIQLVGEKTLTMDGDLTIEDECCGKLAAEVTLANSGATATGNIVINGEVENSGTLNVGKKANTANIQFVNDLTNNATLNVVSKTNAIFADVVNASDATINLERCTEAVGLYTSIENLDNDGNVEVGAYTKLTVAESLTNDGDINIATSGTGDNSTDGTVVVKSEATATNNGTISNKGVYDNNGATTLTEGSEFIDFVGSQWGDVMPVVNDGAEYICEVNSSNGERFGYALGTKMPTTTVRFVKGAEHQYQLKDYASYAKLATVKYIIAVGDDVEFLFKNAAANEITLGTSLVVESAHTVTFNGGVTKVNGDVTVNTGIISNNGNVYSAQVIVAGNLVMNNDSELEVEFLKGATAATELTTPSWTVNEDVELNGTSTLKVEAKAAVDFNGDLTIAEKASAEFSFDSYSDIAGTITNNGKFNRVLSSKTDSNANPAQVWCTKYINNGTQVNGAAQVFNAK